MFKPRKYVKWLVFLTAILITVEISANPPYRPRPSPEGVPSLPPPEVVSVLYRADTRSPDQIFVQGFLSWEEVLGTEGDHDIVNHINGVSLNQGRIGGTGPTPFVSTTSDDYTGMIFVFQMGLAMSTGNIPLQQYIWLYDIEPQSPSNVIPVHWASMDYVQRHTSGASSRPDTDRAVEVDKLDDQFYKQREWAFEGSIPVRSIIQARRFALDENGLYSHDGHVVSNPNYMPSILAQMQTGNIIDSFDPQEPIPEPEVEDDFYAVTLNYTNSGDAGTILPSLTGFDFSCVSEASQGSPRKRKSCLINPKKSVYYGPSSTTKLDVQFRVFSYPNVGNDCLQPKASLKRVEISTTDCSAAAVWRYDNKDRFSTLINGVYWCMVYPENIVNANQNMCPEAVELELCSINNDDQKFIMSRGVLYNKYGKYRYPVRMKDGVLIMSINNAGKKLELKSEGIGRLERASEPASFQTELALNWKYGGKTFYSNYKDNYPWGSSYWNRSYYDPVRKTISYIDYRNSDRMPTKYCLRSRVGNYNWNWTDWVKCNDVSPVFADVQWEFVNRDVAYRNLNQVQFYNLYRSDTLWVTLTGTNAGFYFTSKSGKYSNGTNIFGISSDAPINIPYVSEN